MTRTKLGVLCAFIAVLGASAVCNPARAVTEAQAQTPREAALATEARELARANWACVALTQARGLTAPALAATLGDLAAIPLMSERPDDLMRGLFASGIDPQAEALAMRIRRGVMFFLGRQEGLRQAHEALASIRSASPQLLTEAEDLMTREMVDDARPARVAAAAQLVMLTQRLGKSAAEMTPVKSLDPEAVFLLEGHPIVRAAGRRPA